VRASAFRLAVDGDGIGVVTFDVPGRSVNVFTAEVVAELDQLIVDLSSRRDITVLVLRSGKEKGFVAGADLDAIAGLTDPDEAGRAARAGQGIMSAWEALPFPTVAAVHGAAMGGGTEICLASSFIVVSDREDTRLGLPEVRIGILPGWGGCTRLPRRIDLPDALGMIVEGRSVRASKAVRIGLAEALLPDASFDRFTRAFAERVAGGAVQRQRRGGFKNLVLGGNPIGRRLVFDQARTKTLEATKGHYPAPLRAIEVVRVGIERGPAAGFEAEARAIAELATSSECKNLIHVFRLNERARKQAPLDGDDARPIDCVAVVGAGVMGGGIAHLLADKGIQVRLKDISADGLATGVAFAAKLFRRQVERRRLSEPEAERRLALLRPTLGDSGFGGCDLMIEAVVEDLDVKQRVLAAMEASLGHGTILASNTSSLDIDALGARTSRPELVVGMHFFNPVYKMPLVEVVVGKKTSTAAANTALELARRLGKTPIIVKSAPGFLVNRLLGFYTAEALWLLNDGHSVETIDEAVTAWGMPVGPLALIDDVGIDVAIKVANILAAAFGARLPLPNWVDDLPAPGRLGKKTMAGIYRYEKGRRAKPDPAIFELVGQPEPRPLRGDHLVERMVLRMVDEAARCLVEGVASKPSDIDLAMIMGTGFPPFRGGLCRWADRCDVARLVHELERLAASVGKRFGPSDALRAVAEDGGFY